jgi:hypothetical protein
LLRLRRFMSGHKLATILAVGIVARIILMPISAHPFDVYCWYSTSMDILRNGPLSVQFFPPLWGHYMMIPIAYIYNWLAGVFSTGAIPMASLAPELNFYPSYNIQYVPGLLFNSVVKFTFLVSDILVTLLLYKTVEEITKNKGLAQKAALFWFLNPFVIWISAGWGMWDTLSVLFSLAAFFLLLKKKIAVSAVCLSLGVAVKLYPALFLVPIAFYFLKTSPAGERLKNSVKFYSVFAVTSVLLFLPYLGAAVNFFTSFFVGSPVSNAAAVVNPVVEPLGFGLTYWSLYLLNRIFNLPVSAGVVSIMSVVSAVMAAVFLIVVYWKTSKLTFQKPAFDLGAAMLFSLLALFLSYRIICEQWFVWVLPFMIILCIGGRVKETIYWGTSLIAVLYSVLNCPLPFFFLPLAPWIGNNLLWMVYTIWTVEPIRIVLLAILGCVFSVIMLLALLKLNKSVNQK